MILRLLVGDRQFAELEAAPGEKLSEAIWLSGKTGPSPLCGGIAMCGRCRARFLGDAPVPATRDIEYFSAEDLAAGWRLTCQHRAPLHAGVLSLELPPWRDMSMARSFQTDVSSGEKTYLGIDLGTTSIQWRAVDGDDRIQAQGTSPNPQAGAGADVIARLAYAHTAAGRKRLALLASGYIASVVSGLEALDLPPQRICVAANSAMSAILLEKDTSGLEAAPYFLAWSGGEFASLPGNGLNVLVPPLFSPFVGGDISAGLLNLLDRGVPRPFILADLGTNAELALVGASEELFLASVPLGPALEGIGPQCGQQAGPAVITSFTQNGDSLAYAFAAENIPSTEPAGISATGYLSLLAILLRLGIMNSEGHFQRPEIPIARKLAGNIRSVGGSTRLYLENGLFLSAHDVELLLKVKAAFSTALRSLMGASRLEPASIAAICIAGALGEHASISSLATLGFLPAILARRTVLCGNTSLAGACLLARNPDMMGRLERMKKDATVLQLADDPQFLKNYMASMVWDWNART